MANTNWKGSIIDTYNGNEKFAGNNRDAKGVDNAPGVDFLQQLYKGVESVDGFKTKLNPKDHTPTNFNMVDTTSKIVSPKFEELVTNKGYAWDGISGISPFNNKKKYKDSIKLV
jgi:hypothetical protein